MNSSRDGSGRCVSYLHCETELSTILLSVAKPTKPRLSSGLVEFNFASPAAGVTLLQRRLHQLLQATRFAFSPLTTLFAVSSLQSVINGHIPCFGVVEYCI